MGGTVIVIADTGCPGRRGRRLAESWPTKQHNHVRHIFLRHAAHDLFEDWDTQSRGCVTRLRAHTGTHPDPGYGLIAKLRVVQPELEMLPPDAASIELPQT